MLSSYKITVLDLRIVRFEAVNSCGVYDKRNCYFEMDFCICLTNLYHNSNKRKVFEKQKKLQQFILFSVTYPKNLVKNN